MALLESIRLVLLIGSTLPTPAPPTLMEMLRSVEVTQREDGQSGFQFTVALSRAGPGDVIDHHLLLGPTLKPFNRVIIGVIVQGMPHVLIDGIITHRQHAPGDAQGDALLTVTGEDLSVMMDLEEKRTLHPCCDDMTAAALILAGYARYQIVPTIVPPLAIDPPLPIVRVPSQQGTDLQHLRLLAKRNGYIFCVEPGPVPLTNFAYWGPPRRLSVPQRALSIGMGPGSNVDQLDFSYNALAAATVSDDAQDSLTGQRFPLRTFAGLRLPPLALSPALPAMLGPSRTVVVQESSGLNVVAAMGRAQAATDRSTDAVVSAKGRLDVLRYGGVLKARGLVGVRGAGATHDGLYHVSAVTHRISHGTYAQDFTLNREGEMTTTPVVVP